MDVLIVEADPSRGALWQGHLARAGMRVALRTTSEAAIRQVSEAPVDVLILNLDLGPGSSAEAVADYAEYRRPEAKVIFVSDDRFFSDGAIFALSAQTRALVGSGTAPGDLAALVEHHGRTEVLR